MKTFLAGAACIALVAGLIGIAVLARIENDRRKYLEGYRIGLQEGRAECQAEAVRQGYGHWEAREIGGAPKFVWESAR